MLLSELKKKLSKNFLINGIETPELDARLVLKEVLSFDDKDLILKENNDISEELTRKILSKAAMYEKQNKKKNFKPYNNQSSPGD